MHFKNKEDYKRENNIVIMFQNVKKLKRNINIIKEDRGFKAADVLIFVQTSSLDSDKLFLHNYSLINFLIKFNIRHTLKII